MTNIKRAGRVSKFILAWAAALSIFGTTAAVAQNKDQDQPADERIKVRDGHDGVELIKYETADHVFLRATYYEAKGTPDKPKPKGEDTPVVMLLHKRNGSQQDWIPFARYLQSQGFSVLTFDFRGHGDSVFVGENYLHPKDARDKAKKLKEHDREGRRVVTPGSREQRIEEEEKKKKRARKIDKPIEKIDQKTEFRNPQDFLDFSLKDLEAMKRKLIEKNNSHNINLRKLAVVAVDDACMVAMKWLADYEFVDAHHKGKAGWNRQGADVNAIVFISPPLSYYGVKATSFLSKINEKVPVCVVTNSKGKTEVVDGGKIADVLKVPLRAEENSKDAKSPAARKSDKSRPDSIWLKLDSDQSGMALLNPPVAQIDGDLSGFLYHRLRDEKGLRAWEKRATDVDLSGFGSEREKQ